MANDLQQKISDSVKTGAPLVASYDEIISIAKNPDGPVVQVDIDVPQAVAGLEQLAGVIAGGSISTTVPKALLPSGAITLQTVSFSLFTDTRKIGDIACLVTFGAGGQGLTWNITKIGNAQLSVTLNALLLKWITPGTPAQFIAAIANGSTTLGTLTLDVTVTYPQPTLTLTQPGSDFVNLGDFFDQLGLPSVSFLHELLIEDFSLEFDFGQSQTSFYSQVAASGNTGVTLIPNPGGGPAILAFEQMTLAFTSANGAVDASIQGTVLLLGDLALGVQAARNDDGSWSFGGNIDIAGTWSRLHAGATPPPGPVLITVADFATIVAPGSSPPDALKTFGIAALSVDYSYSASQSSSYTFDGVFAGDWQVGADLKAQLEIALSNTGNKVSADFDIDGVSFELSYTFGNGPKEIDAKIDAGDVLSLSGSYNLDSGVVTLTFDKALHFDRLIAWFVGEVTGNRYFTLPDPWDEVLAAIELPQGLKLTINTQTKAIDCEYPLPSPISFLGFTLKGVEIGYDPTKKASGQSGLTVKIDSDLPDWITIGEWDPGTQQPPKVPGSSAALLDIKLLGAGQHIGFNTPPATVEAAITELGAALDPKNWTGGLYPKTAMSFSKDVGWLIGSEVVLLGQVDIKFIFNDPLVYGLSLIVSSGKSAALNVLSGLSAEIIYRKVSDTVGVYEGTLTLPSDIRKIDLNQVVITLPQLALSIYTNGDFKIDVGFPYNRDFSRSCSVVAAEYAGAGGFYYAKLDGLDPSELPQIDTSKGIFSPVTEIGIGFELGVTKSFSAGPLSASCSVMLQGIFQGTFAKYTRYADNHQDEFFAVDATVAIVGHLVGNLDFVIITASLEVTVYIEVDLRLVAYRQTVAEVEVGVSVELTVSINCGFFTIHIHCGFSTTLHTQASFGQNGTGLWEQSLAAPHRVLMAVRSAPPPSVGWQPIADTNPLTAYFIPQLTAGLAYPQSDGNTHWYYVGQLALSNPAANAGAGKTLANQDPSYAHFVRGMLRWALYAYGNTGNPNPVSAAAANAKLISGDDVSNLHDALADSSAGAWPLIADVQAQFKAAFQTTMQALPSGAGTDFGVGFFPAVPGMSIGLQADANAAVTLSAARLSAAHLQAAKQGGPAEAPRTTFLAHLQSSTNAATTTPQSISELMTVDFAVLAVRSGLQKIIDAKILPDKGQMSIGDVLNAIQDPVLAAISGMTSRFMLHGTRQPDPGSGALEPLYALTGQQAPLSSDELQAANLTMSLSFTQGAPADWGMTFQGGGNSLSLSSADPNPVVFKPSQILAAPPFSPGNVQSGAMSIADTRPARFYLTTGIEENDGPGIWQLPQALADHLSQPGGNETFLTYYLANPTANPVAVTASFVFSIDFRIRRIPATDGTAGTLANTYELFGIDQGEIQSLQTLVTQFAAGQTPVSNLSLAYASGAQSSGGGTTARQAVIASVDFSRTFIVQSNFSTETHPPPAPMLLMASRPDPKAMASFLTKLWTAGITNSGGYYLFDAPPDGQSGLPDTLFDRGGVATLTLIADLALSNGANAVALPAYVTGLRTPGQPVGGAGSLYLASDQLTAVRAVLPAGHVGVDVSCDVPPAPGNSGSYGGSLNQLYNLITAESVTINGAAMPQAGLPPVFGPVDPDASGAGSRWNYRHVFPLIGSPIDPPPPVPPPSLNPYTSIGATVGFGLMWTDLFGNEWGPVAPAVSTQLKYFDPLVSLSQLPYLTLDYVFAGPSGSAQLQIGFSFAAPAYQSSDATRRLNDIAAYARAYYQLVDLANGAQIAATVTTSLVVASGAPSPIAVDIATIRGNIAKIYAVLVALPLGGTPPAVTLDPVQIAVPANGTQIYSALKFPLTVALTFGRTGPIADGFPADGPVKTISMTIAPRTAAKAGDSHSLADFASAFETAFKPQDLVLAVGANAGQGLTGDSHQIWVVRYGASGIGIAFPAQAGSPAYFAPRPLDNVLRSRPVAVRAVNADGTLGSGSTVAVADIDLDAQMRKFLTAFDLMFSAADAIPTALINAAAINDLSTQKKAIVEKLLGYVTDLTSGTSYDPGSNGPADPITAAADRYRQECLVRMGAFYDMNAAAVASVTASFGGAADPGLNIFGHPMQAADPTATGEKEFTLTSGKSALSTTAVPMAVGLFAKHVSAYSQYVGNPSFLIDAIEHDIAPVTVEGTTYQVGSWLKFINPRPALPMPPLTIPIPLRAFPQPPQLIRQYAVELISDAPVTTDANLMLELAKSWSLNGSYQHAFAAQDRVHLDVQINRGLGGPAMVRSAAPSKDLLDTLVEFNQIYPQLQTLFTVNKLAGIRTPEAAQKAATLKNALQSFATLVDDVATCSWTLKPQSPLLPLLRADGLLARETRYVIQDGFEVEKPTDIWRAMVSFEQDVSQPVGIIPQLQIEGYQAVVDQQTATSITYKFADPANPGTFLQAAAASQIAGRTVAVMPPYGTQPFSPLQIVDRQNGLLSMMIGRNENLPPSFHYQTPWVTYTETISPILDTSTRIDIAGVGQPNGQPAKRSIAAHLTALFAALVQGSGEPAPIAGSFQAVSYFAYPPAAGPAQFDLVDLPIALRLPTDIEFDAPVSGTPPYVTAIADIIAAWLSANGLSAAARPALWQRSELRFDISLFSSASLTGRPILRLRNLFIACGNIG